MKIRQLTYILFAVIFAFFATACSENAPDVPEAPGTDCFYLTIDVPLAASSRAVADELNEFKVRSLHLYFFKTAGHDDATSTCLYDVDIPGEFDVQRSVRLALPDNCLQPDGLFGNDNTCYVYAVANVDPRDLEGNTIALMKASKVRNDFEQTRPQDKFAMDGFATITLDRPNRLATGTVTLERAAAKLTLSVDLPSSIDIVQKIIDPFTGEVTEKTVTYTSHASEMHLWIANGVKESVLNTEPAPVGETSLYSHEIYVADEVGSAFTYDAAQPKYRYLQNIPFYSYPNKWDPYSPKGNTFLTLEIPWSFTNDSGQRENVVTYYRLSVQPNDYFIERNTHYDMRVTISRLGGTSVQQPVDMLFDWNYIMQWNTQTLPTDIKEIRYLLLNSNDFRSDLDAYYYEMNNETEISLPFSSSHPVEIESIKMTWRDYYNNADRNIDLYTNSGNYRYTTTADYNSSTHFAGADIDSRNSILNLERALRHIKWQSNRATITSDAAISAYTFTIKIRHTDAVANNPASHATIVIRQIPAINITTLKTASSSSRFVNANYSTTSTTYGYVSGTTPSNSRYRDYWLGSIHGSDYAKNTNTYVLTISKFDENDDYIIADPRKRTTDNLNAAGSTATRASWSRQDNSRKYLTNYYPADDNADKTRFIAPKLRVASQWGVTYQLYRRGAERRCASYQENGRPAGRWRLPTVAEIQYIANLSNKEFIPYLFGSESNNASDPASYWCASGVVRVINSTTNPSVTIVTPGTNDKHAVRCVYDEWYWADDTLTNKNVFTWGDKARTTNGN